MKKAKFRFCIQNTVNVRLTPRPPKHARPRKLSARGWPPRLIHESNKSADPRPRRGVQKQEAGLYAC